MNKIARSSRAVLVRLGLLAGIALGALSVPQVSHAAAICNDKIATIVAAPGQVEIYGTNGPDVIVGNGQRNVIHGFDGNDTICGGGGDDMIFGGRGNDWLEGGDGLDWVYGGSNMDVIFGGFGPDLLYGDGANVLGGAEIPSSEGSQDFMFGGDGDDYLFDFQMYTSMDGGPGSDRCRVYSPLLRTSCER